MASYARDLKKILKNQGCFFVRQGKGSHEVWKTSAGICFVIPTNCKSKQMANVILKQAGIKEKL